MIKFSMHCFDVLFPINLGPLTYRCPEILAETAQLGMVIHAPLKNKMTRGIILAKNSSPPPGQLKELQVLPGESVIISRSLLKLVRWMADYYLVTEGLALKQTIPKELFEKKVRVRRNSEAASSASGINFIDIPEEDMRAINAGAQAGGYQGFLLHAPSVLYEYSMVFSLAAVRRNIIVLLPDTWQADLLFNSLKEQYSERACLLHGEISRGRRSQYLDDILTGRRDIVIGTRAALFAPLKPSLIVVLNEHSRLYKVEEGMRFNIRDVAIMRGFMEKTPVLLTSISPSIDSYFNAVTGKYRLIRPSHPSKRPSIRIADMKYEKKIRPDFSRTVYESARRHIRKNSKILFVMNRRGYSTLLLCNECSYIVKCPSCNIPLVFYKSDNALKCHYCNQVQPVAEKCPRCGSHNLELLGSGTQRVQEDVEELFEKATLMFDSDNARSKTEKDEISRLIEGDFSRILIGTRLMTSRISASNKYSMAAIMNIDCTLNMPDFRATEKAFQEISAVMDLVEPEGEVLIQTRFPELHLFRGIRSNDYMTFAHEEISLRKGLGYPPYAKLLQLTFTGTSELYEKISRTILKADPKIEILGHTVKKNRAGSDDYSLVLKSADRKSLNNSAKAVLKAFGRLKNAQIRTDVDPV